MTLAPVDIIDFIAIFQLIVFVIFLFQRKNYRQANRILGTFLFAQILMIFNFEVFQLQGYMAKGFAHLLMIGTPAHFIAGPSFYLYVKTLAFADFRLEKKHLLHALPVVLVYLFFSYKFYFLPLDTKKALLTGVVQFPKGFWFIFYLGVFTQLLIYFLADLRILKYYRNEIRQQYSSVNNINLSWLSFLLSAFIIAWLSSVAVFLSRNYFWNVYNELQFVNLLFFFIFFNYIFYKGLSRPDIFSGIEEKPKYIASKLTEVEAQEYLKKLLSVMEKDKPYLNPNLNLKELSERLAIPSRYLSQIINDRMHQNFYDYISQYRIDEAKRIMSDKSNRKTVLEVLYEVGFNSKSSFNTSFKKFTGMTPTHFRKKSGEPIKNMVKQDAV